MSGARIPDGSKTRRAHREDLDLIECADRTLEVLQGKWKVHLLFVMARGVHRYSRLLECLPGISNKVMTESLRALERDGLVVRKAYAEVPVRVEYSLSMLGWTLTEPLVALSDWGSAHGNDVADARLGDHRTRDRSIRRRRKHLSLPLRSRRSRRHGNVASVARRRDLSGGV
jgi:DNA-binding HxlR family transcriptional regulator